MENNKTRKYHLNFISFIISGIWPLIILSISLILLLPLMIESYKKEEQFGVWLASIIMISLFAIPPILIILNYLFNDKGKSLIIDDNAGRIVLIKNSVSKEVLISDISNIIKYHSDMFLLRLPLNSFYYYRINLRNKEFFYISCLVINNFEKKISGVEFNSMGVYIPLIMRSPRQLLL